MTDLTRLTKAEIIKLYEQSEEEKKVLEEQFDKAQKAIEQDMSFGRTEKELTEHQKAQRRKDFIKRMTHGRWVSEDKYQEFMDEQERLMRQGGRF